VALGVAHVAGSGELSMMLDGLSKVGPRIEKRKCCQDAG